MRILRETERTQNVKRNWWNKTQRSRKSHPVEFSFAQNPQCTVHTWILLTLPTLPILKSRPRVYLGRLLMFTAQGKDRSALCESHHFSIDFSGSFHSIRYKHWVQSILKAHRWTSRTLWMLRMIFCQKLVSWIYSSLWNSRDSTFPFGFHDLHSPWLQFGSRHFMIFSLYFIKINISVMAASKGEKNRREVIFFISD